MMNTKIDIEERIDYVVMHLEGDYNNVEDNNKLLDSIKNLAKTNKINVIIDLTNVVYLDSRSLGVLLSGNSLLKKKSGKLVLFGANDYIVNLFNITRLDLAFGICKTEEEAIEVIAISK